MNASHGSDDLYGSAPDNCPVALLLIDVINDLEFDGAEALQQHAEPMAERIAALRQRAYDHGIPVIFVNDNFGHWRSDLSVQVRHCLRKGVRGRRLAELLKPREEDYFILKPRHSGFHMTPLQLLLASLGARTLILTGVAGNICVLFTANDAYMHQFDLVVPRDCVASNDEQSNRFAIEQMRDVLKADVRPAEQLDLKELLQRS